MHVEQLIAQHVADGTQFTLVAITITQQARIREASAISEGRKIQSDDLKLVDILADFLGFLIAVQPHTQTAIACLQRVRVFAPQRQRHDQVVAVRQAVKGRVLGQQMPGFIDDFVVLNDSLHRRAP